MPKTWVTHRLQPRASWRERAQALREAWVEFLLRFHVQWFCTMAFRNTVGLESGTKRWRR